MTTPMNKKIQATKAAMAHVSGYADINTFVETGTAFATTTVAALEIFTEVHSIDLSPELHKRAVEQHGDRAGLTFHFGDSAEVLPRVLAGIDRPVVVLLDAHYCLGFGGKAAKKTFPLWAELDVFKARKHADLVLVDDIHTFGRDRQDIRVTNGVEWEGVTPQALVKHMGDRLVAHAPFRDQYALYLSAE